MNHDFSRLPEMFDLASRAQVNCALHFGAGSEDWYVAITSAAPSENWTGRDWSCVDLAIDDAIRHLNKLLGRTA